MNENTGIYYSKLLMETIRNQTSHSVNIDLLEIKATVILTEYSVHLQNCRSLTELCPALLDPYNSISRLKVYITYIIYMIYIVYMSNLLLWC